MWLKTDLHVHTCEGPDRFVPWTPEELIDRAAREGFRVLSFTDHDQVTYGATLARYAQDRGIVLIPGVEASIEGRHILLYNFDGFPRVPKTFSEVRHHKGTGTLVVAPHPFFPGPTSLRRRFVEQVDLFDAVEYSHFYTRWLNYNRPALRLAQDRGLPLLGTSDAHIPGQFGTTYSLVEAAPTPEAVLDAIRCGRVQVVTRPLGTGAAIAIGWALAGGTILQEIQGHIQALRNAVWKSPVAGSGRPTILSHDGHTLLERALTPVKGAGSDRPRTTRQK
jgi:predicted metal-dependent phosphoesterase TrpH